MQVVSVHALGECLRTPETRGRMLWAGHMCYALVSKADQVIKHRTHTVVVVNDYGADTVLVNRAIDEHEGYVVCDTLIDNTVFAPGRRDDHALDRPAAHNTQSIEFLVLLVIGIRRDDRIAGCFPRVLNAANHWWKQRVCQIGDQDADRKRAILF